MIPGPIQIIACPHCSVLAKYMTLVSGNTFGAKVWTDGKHIAPMLPRPPAVVECHSCGECFWLADARKVGSLEPYGSGGGDVDPAWAAAPYVLEPTEEAYHRALRKGLAVSPEQQRTLRILAWWRGNDAVRDTPNPEDAGVACGSEARRENLEALARLLDEGNENDRVMKAEVFRELGDFESALRLLGRVTAPDYAAVVRQLRSMCEDGDTCVRQLQLGG